MTDLKRLNKFISDTGFCSRREADKYIEDGRVTVNGIRPEMGVKVSSTDVVLVDGKTLKAIPVNAFILPITNPLVLPVLQSEKFKVILLKQLITPIGSFQ